MTITCPKCKKNSLEEVFKLEPLVCEKCGREFKLQFTGKIYKEGE